MHGLEIIIIDVFSQFHLRLSSCCKSTSKSKSINFEHHKDTFFTFSLKSFYFPTFKVIFVSFVSLTFPDDRDEEC